MTADSIESLYGSGIYAPYSREEEGAFVYSATAPVREVLDCARHQYISLIHLVDDWVAYSEGISPKPPDEPVRFLFPGRNAENSEVEYYEKLAEFFAGYAHGATPRIGELYDTSKVCLSFLRRLGDIKATDHLQNAKRHFTDFIRLVDYRGEPRMLRDEFSRRIVEASDSFLRERTANALEIGQLLSGQPKSLAAAANPDDAPPSVQRDNIRMKAVSLIKGYRKATSCSTSEAVRKVQAALWRDFHRLNLKSDIKNFSILLYKPKFGDSPPADVEDLRSACLDFGG